MFLLVCFGFIGNAVALESDKLGAFAKFNLLIVLYIDLPKFKKNEIRNCICLVPHFDKLTFHWLLHAVQMYFIIVYV